MPQTISIIIPVLNEAETIIKLLAHLNGASTSSFVAEIILVDGGSCDDTVDIIENFRTSTVCESINGKGLKHIPLSILHSEKGRAKQMNLGAKMAKGSILYFLHADSFPPKNFDQFIINEVEKGNEAGCFQMCFDSSHWWLSIAGWLTRFNWRACRGGDQSQFITASLFDDIGGFDERYVIYEDNILINELYKRSSFVVIRNKLTTSPRLYEKKGIWRLQYHFWAIYIKKWFGASPEELHRYYLNKVRDT